MPSSPSITAHDAARELARRLKSSGHEALFAGGCVRDRLLGHEPKDYDIATSAVPSEVLDLFPGSNEVGAHFGVVIAKHGGHHVEIATFRTDGSYRDGRRPESVEFSNPKEDAQRRDFTINGLFENPETGEVIDFVGGLADLKAGILRAIGDPVTRFTEDGLRLLRAARFANSLGFTIEPRTDAAIRECAPLLDRISPERIRDEFSKIISAPRRRNGIEYLVETDLIRHFMPEVLALIGCDQPPEWHPEGDVFTHTMIMLEMLAPDAPLELCLAVLLHDIAKPPCRSVDAESGRVRFNGHDALGAHMAENILRRRANGRPPHAIHECAENAPGKTQALHGRSHLRHGNGTPSRRLRILQRLHRQLRFSPRQGRRVRQRTAHPTPTRQWPRPHFPRPQPRPTLQTNPRSDRNGTTRRKNQRPPPSAGIAAENCCRITGRRQKTWRQKKLEKRKMRLLHSWRRFSTAMPLFNSFIIIRPLISQMY
jgi:tRNA nucleotidyltransferase/poly(A) polymerase